MDATTLRTPHAFPGKPVEPLPRLGVPQDLRDALLLHIRHKYGNQKAAADAWGVSSPFVSKVLRDRASPTVEMLNDAGIEMWTRRVTLYEWRKVLPPNV